LRVEWVDSCHGLVVVGVVYWERDATRKNLAG
jgi:hypothetical protein